MTTAPPVGKHPIYSRPPRFNVGSVSPDAADQPCFLAEWYRPDLTREPLQRTAARLRAGAASVTAAGTPVHLTSMLALPSDEVLFGVFSADSVSAVAQACTEAGYPAQRLTNALDAHIADVNR